MTQSSRKYLATIAHMCVVVRSVNAGLTAASGLPLWGGQSPMTTCSSPAIGWIAPTSSLTASLSRGEC